MAIAIINELSWVTNLHDEQLSWDAVTLEWGVQDNREDEFAPAVACCWLKFLVKQNDWWLAVLKELME